MPQAHAGVNQNKNQACEACAHMPDGLGNLVRSYLTNSGVTCFRSPLTFTVTGAGFGVVVVSL